MIRRNTKRRVADAVEDVPGRENKRRKVESEPKPSNVVKTENALPKEIKALSITLKDVSNATNIQEAAIRKNTKGTTAIKNESKVGREKPKKTTVKKDPDAEAKFAIKKEEEGSSEETEDSDIMEDIETKRLANLRDNAEFLAKLGMSAAKMEFKQSVAKRKSPKATSQPTSRGYRETLEKKVLPRRQSLRLQNITPDNKHKIIPELLEASPPEYVRPAGPLNMSKVIKNMEETEIHDKFLTQLSELKINVKKEGLSIQLEKYVRGMQTLSINEDRVAKVVPNRIFSMAIHPTEDKVLAIAGGKWGNLGFWDVSSKDGQDGVYTYEVHSRPIRSIIIPRENQDRVYTCSYDGSLRCGYLGKGMFEEVYLAEEDVLLNDLAMFDPNTILACQNDGYLARIDVRENAKLPSKCCLYQMKNHKSVRSVSVHPIHNNYIATSHFNGTIQIWDIRKLVQDKNNKSIWTGRHAKSVESAYFSPVTGNRLLTTSMDDTLGLFNTENVVQTGEVTGVRMFRHNNHTGRWLSKFRAIWHPSRDDCFVSGSMERPRRIELFCDRGSLVHTFKGEHLASVCSLNAIHPTLDVLVGGNSSGRVHVFM